MSFSDRYTKLFRYLLPSPFTIALLLTVITFGCAFIFTGEGKGIAYGYDLLTYWEEGLWDNGLMVFAMQMMLMLVLGHTLALTTPAKRLIAYALRYCTGTARAAFLVTLLTVCVAFFNWGLGLIFGAIFARKVAEHAKQSNYPLNYPLIGAAGYSGLMVWHGGLSGSSLTKISESGHLRTLMTNILSPSQIATLPEQITFSETVFSGMNLTVSFLLLLILPAGMYMLGKYASNSEVTLPSGEYHTPTTVSQPRGLEKLDHARWPALTAGLIMIVYAFYHSLIRPETIDLGFITPNFINFSLLALSLLFHGSFSSFLAAIDDAISGAAGILVQFPLYFGIMGIMKSSGLVGVLSDFFVNISNNLTFPLFTFFSAGLVNVFVPSGGGQWAVQGPIIVKAALELNVPLTKGILALAYGDQITNMLQPFWALPLLGITGLKAKDILPYTLYLMVLGSIIFIGCLLIF